MRGFVDWLCRQHGPDGHRLSDRSVYNAALPLRACLHHAHGAGLAAADAGAALVLPRRRHGRSYEFDERRFLTRQQLERPASQVVAFRSELDWATLGAIPEMLQTAHGSLTVGLDAQPGQTLLIRGGTSSIGMAAAILAKDRGLTVLATTRQPDRVAALKAVGVDHVLVDDGGVAAQVRAIVPNGVQVALELVGTNTLPDTLRATAVHGVVCFTGMLSNEWTVADFYPIDYLPTGVRLTAYGGEAADLPGDVLQGYLDAVAAGRLTVPIDRTYVLDEIGQAHADMEHGRATGKLVVVT